MVEVFLQQEKKSVFFLIKNQRISRNGKRGNSLPIRGECLMFPPHENVKPFPTPTLPTSPTPSFPVHLTSKLFHHSTLLVGHTYPMSGTQPHFLVLQSRSPTYFSLPIPISPSIFHPHFPRCVRRMFSNVLPG